MSIAELRAFYGYFFYDIPKEYLVPPKEGWQLLWRCTPHSIQWLCYILLFKLFNLWCDHKLLVWPQEDWDWLAVIMVVCTSSLQFVCYLLFYKILILWFDHKHLVRPKGSLAVIEVVYTSQHTVVMLLLYKLLILWLTINIWSAQRKSGSYWGGIHLTAHNGYVISHSYTPQQVVLYDTIALSIKEIF